MNILNFCCMLPNRFTGSVIYSKEFDLDVMFLYLRICESFEYMYDIWAIFDDQSYVLKTFPQSKIRLLLPLTAELGLLIVLITNFSKALWIGRETTGVSGLYLFLPYGKNTWKQRRTQFWSMSVVSNPSEMFRMANKTYCDGDFVE